MLKKIIKSKLFKYFLIILIIYIVSFIIAIKAEKPDHKIRHQVKLTKIESFYYHSANTIFQTKQFCCSNFKFLMPLCWFLLILSIFNEAKLIIKAKKDKELYYKLRKYFFICLSIFFSWFIIHSIIICIDGLNDEIKKSDMCVVLGNKVNTDGSLSERLKSRLDKSIELYNKKYFKYIMVSGGLGKENFNEAKVMKKYLIKNKIPIENIILDNSGINTYQTAKITKVIINQYKFKSVLVVSQYFHITRLKLIFSKLKIKNIYSAHCNYFEIRDIYSIVREFFAYYYYLIRY